MATEAERERAKKGIKARQDAVRWLIAENQAAFNNRVEENRVALGLPRRPQGESREELAAKTQRAEERLQRLQEQLRQAEADSRLSRV